jgi:hypothetical protein
MENGIYKISEVKLEAVKAKILVMNRKALKLGTEPVVLSVVGEEMRPVYEKDLLSGEFTDKVLYQRKIMLVKFSGEAPRLDGWAFVAAVLHGDKENIFRQLRHDIAIPKEFRTSAYTRCDHCNTERYRKDTYLLNNGSEWKQVGRSCLKDFLGGVNPSSVLAAAEMLSNFREELEGYESESDGSGGERGYRERPYYPLKEVMLVAARFIKTYGFKSYAKASEEMAESTATSYCVRSFFSARKEDNAELKLEPVNEEMAAEAEAAIKWAAELPEDSDNDYLWNIRAVALNENIDERMMGLAVSIIPSYRREQEKKMPDFIDDYYGQVGTKIDAVGVALREIPFESQWGVGCIIKFRVDDKLLVWKTSGTGHVIVGEKIRIKATIKGNDIYNGKKQTVITRAKLLPVEEVK